MLKKFRFVVIACVILGIIIVAVRYLHGENIAVLNPAGPIARAERNLIYLTLLLSLIVVIPVFTMLIVFAWRYRESNPRAAYTPDWDHSRVAETIWWTVPTILITVLSVITWRSSHQLDPYRPLASRVAPITIQVVALDWKWLFIYPQAGVASVNYLEIPVGAPVTFEVTSDAPMNSFWIPQLGGQIYAMPGMSAQLNLMADRPGEYRGLSSNISGDGFSGMVFETKATSSQDYQTWIHTLQTTSPSLTVASYNRLAAPSSYNPVAYYTATGEMYNQIIMSYMMPMSMMPSSGDSGSMVALDNGDNQ